MVTCAIGRWRWSGAIPGALLIGVVLLSGVLNYLPGQVGMLVFLFGGGLVAGLLTRGAVKDGAISGAACGVILAVIVAAITALMSLRAHDPLYPAPLATFGFYALFLIVLMLPYNAIGGAAGTLVRNGIRGGGTPAGTPWAGVVIGTIVIVAFFIAASTLFVTPGPLLVAAPIAGGFIAGFAVVGGTRDGLEVGFVTALFGTGLCSIPLLWTASYGEGFVAGLAGMLMIALGYLYIILGTAAGAAGAVVRAKLRKDEVAGGEG
ncbi:DUF5518 domain-containing protein [Methanoculleus sp.]|uniref:DUF5518 domain-containing protein n=1 Tax=Methanoculleus sp. TaxID=90427 RepID=UPI00261865B0|nr:DUF5518 domain-containing protein [Methanoculleus sp.]MDI6867803.1 DUF5518 domain-containing protein [Methanoculleus sp.]